MKQNTKICNTNNSLGQKKLSDLTIFYMNTEVNAGMKPTHMKLTVNLPDSVVTIHFTIILHTVLHLEFYQ
jgi:hypothetical protein